MMRSDLIQRDLDGKLTTWLNVRNLYKDYLDLILSSDFDDLDDSEIQPAYEKISNVWSTTSCTVSC